MNRREKITLGIVLFVLAIALIFLVSNKFFISTTTPSSNNYQELSQEKLTFCSDVQGCYNYLAGQGITKDMLNQKGVTIICDSTQCLAKKV